MAAWELVGESNGDKLGHALSGGTDFDGDGAPDLMASGEGAAVLMRNAGAAGGFAFGATLFEPTASRRLWVRA